MSWSIEISDAAHEDLRDIYSYIAFELRSPEGRFSAPKMRRPNKINGFAGSVPRGGGAGRNRSL